MIGKIKTVALEEHYWSPAIKDARDQQFLSGIQGEVTEKLDDIGTLRLREMDEAGVDLQVISLSAPGVEPLEAETAISVARDSNDMLAEAVRAHPTRFNGFAALPIQAPEAAADELERAVRKLGFKGAMINGHTRGRYLDDQKFWVIFERAQALDVPVYVHPTLPPPPVMQTYYRGLPNEMIPAWAFNVEAGIHAVRMILSGLFDRYPKLKMILGHMGEIIPFQLWRLDHLVTPEMKKLERSIGQYFQENFVVTTSGMFSHSLLLFVMNVIGVDNILFSVDYPYEKSAPATEYLRTAPISEVDREKIAHLNAERILHL